jgi:hypothetical protein
LGKIIKNTSWDVAKVVEYLCKHKALSSSPSTSKNKNLIQFVEYSIGSKQQNDYKAMVLYHHKAEISFWGYCKML